MIRSSLIAALLAWAPALALAAPPATGVAVEAKAQPGDYETTGIAAPARVTRLSPKATGVIQSIKVREGAFVSAGQVLCQLDTADISIRLDGAQVAVEQASEGEKNAKDDLARTEELYKGKAVADQMVDKARLGAKMAELQHAQAKVALRAARQALSDSSVRAPFAGVVTKVMAEEGQLATMMPPTMVFELADVNTLEIRVAVPERIFTKVKVGMPVIVAIPALNIERTATIHAMPTVVDSRTRSAEAIIRLENKDRALPAGLFAKVRFAGVRAEGSASVNAAVGASPEGGR